MFNQSNQNDFLSCALRRLCLMGVQSIFAVAIVVGSQISDSPAHALDKVKLGMVPSSYVEAAQQIAKQNGFFEKHGLDVEFVLLKGDILNLRALIGTEVDFASIGSFALINAIQKGANLRAVISTVPEQPHMLVTLKSIKSWKELPGHTFAISQPGAISQTFPRAIMTQLGVDPDTVQYLAIGGNGARQKALLGGKVDATLIHKERAVMVVKSSDKHHVIGSTAQYLKGVPLVYHAARKDWLDKNSDVAQRYVRALIEAARFMVDHKDVMVKYGQSVIKADKKIIAASFEEYKKSGVWGLNGGLSKTGLDFTIKLGVETGELASTIAFDAIVEPRFVDTVLKESGRK